METKDQQTERCEGVRLLGRELLDRMAPTMRRLYPAEVDDAIRTVLANIRATQAAAPALK